MPAAEHGEIETRRVIVLVAQLDAHAESAQSHRPFLQLVVHRFIPHHHARAIALQQRGRGHPAASQSNTSTSLPFSSHGLHDPITSVSARQSNNAKITDITQNRVVTWFLTSRAVRNDDARAPLRRSVAAQPKACDCRSPKPPPSRKFHRHDQHSSCLIITAMAPIKPPYGQ